MNHLQRDHILMTKTVVTGEEPWEVDGRLDTKIGSTACVTELCEE